MPAAKKRPPLDHSPRVDGLVIGEFSHELYEFVNTKLSKKERRILGSLYSRRGTGYNTTLKELQPIEACAPGDFDNLKGQEYIRELGKLGGHYKITSRGAFAYENWRVGETEERRKARKNLGQKLDIDWILQR